MINHSRSFCVGLMMLSSGAVFAGNTPGAVTITVSDAYYHFDERRDLGNSAMPNLSLGYNFTQHFAMEAGAGILNTQQKAELGDDDVQGALYTISGIYRFASYKHLEPYLIGGIGILVLVPTDDDSEHPGVVQAGLGTQLFWGHNMALRAEIRDVYQTTGSSRNDYMINFGVSLLLGGSYK